MKNLGILLFDNAELLDFAGPYEVFSVTNELNDFKLFNVFAIAENKKPIITIHGLKITPDYSINNCPNIDILILPGGDGSKSVIDNVVLLKWINKVIAQSEITFSVCSGARILAKIGLLDNTEFTTHHEVVQDILSIAPTAKISTEKRFVDNGKLMTCGGISAGIDLSLYIVEKLHGQAIKNKTVNYMEYGDWR